MHKVAELIQHCREAKVKGIMKDAYRELCYLMDKIDISNENFDATRNVKDNDVDKKIV